MRQLANKLYARIRTIQANPFIRRAGVLAGATITAQAIALLALPILTRIYSPADFKVLASFTALLGLGSIISCLRFDYAIPVSKSHGRAIHLFALAIIICTLLSGAIAIALLLEPAFLLRAMGEKNLDAGIWLLPIGIWMAGIYSSLQLWALRHKRFKQIAKTRISQGLAGSGAPIALGLYGANSTALIVGQILSTSAGIISLAKQTISFDWRYLRNIRLKGLRAAFFTYSHYPKFSTIEALSNSAGIQVPIILIAAYSAGPEAGYLMLAMRVMFAPLSLIGNAVAQTYLSQAPSELRRGTLKIFTTSVLTGLCTVGLGPILFLGLIAPAFFDLVFGQDWQRAGEIVTWLMPWAALQFLASPISMVMHVTGAQRSIAKLTLIGMVIRIGTVSAALLLSLTFSVEIYAGAAAAFYLLCLLRFTRAATLTPNDVLVVFRTSLPFIAFWVAFGCLLRFALLS